MHAISSRIPIRLTPFSIIGLMLAIVGCGSIVIDIRTQIVSQQEITQSLEYTVSGPLAELLITDGEIDLADDAELADLEAMEAAGWDLQMDVIQIDGDDALRMRLSQTFKGEDAAEQFRLASAALSEEDTATSMVPFLEISETENEVVYELRMQIEVDDAAASTDFETGLDTEPLIIDGTPFPGLPDFGDPDSIGDFGDFGSELEGAFSDGLQDFADALKSSFEDFISVKWTVEMPGQVSESNATDEDGNILTWDLGFAELSDDNSEDLFARSVVSKNQADSCNF